jgi:2'-5' RNA ligase/ADP-ribose pyrophosphatase YjhB (NUDIX family)
VTPRPVVAAQGDWIFYHGTPDERAWEHGSAYGIHVGTEKAAHDALNARIGRPLEGVWDGTREYGKTLLDPGQPTGSERGGEARYPTGRATYSTGDKVPMDARPSVFPVRITGPMIGHPAAPVEDDYANSRLHGQIARGNARRGYFYRNIGEDEGSISAAVPSAVHLERVHSPREATRWQPSSGIFAPTTGLDPRLFEGGSLRPGVRGAVMERLDRCLRADSGLAGSDWQEWLHAWIAGGSASEWAGDRPNDAARDLDVIVGLDLAAAQGYNSFEGMDREQAATALNAAFRHLFNDPEWHPEFGGTWNVTAYCNPHVADDITVIKPYAAWDLTDSRWAVRPPHLPQHSLADFDPAVIAHGRAVLAEARAILRMPEPLRTREARSLWEHVHEHRCQAFSAEGTGWDDPGNVDEKMLAYAPRGVLEKIRELAMSKTAAASPLLHRGLSVEVAPDDVYEAYRSGGHAAVHDVIRSAIGDSAGRHWTTSEDVARSFAHRLSHEPRTLLSSFSLHVPVVLHGHADPEHHVTDPDELRDLMAGWDGKDEHEVTVPQGAPVRVTGMDMALPSHPQWPQRMDDVLGRYDEDPNLSGWHSEPHAWQAVSTESGPKTAASARHSRTAAAAPLRVACLGNSIAAADGDESYLDHACRLSGGKMFHAGAFATGGISSTQAVARHLGEVIAARPDACVLGPLAANNHALGVSLGQTTADIEAAAEGLLRHGITPVLVLEPPHADPEASALIERLNDWVSPYAARRGLSAADFSGPLSSADGIHPDATGARDMGRRLADALFLRAVAAREEAAENPPCRYCGEPLEDEDVRDGHSAHEECQDMRWCRACDEHHDDPQEAEEHNSTYTDWGAHLPFEGGMHRGLTVRLPEGVHSLVHDESAPVAARASALRGHLGENGHHGVHWTDHLPIARAWGSGEGAMFGTVDPDDPAHTHVVLHAASPREEDIEDDPARLAERSMWGFDHDNSEREIPLREGAPVRLTGLSWKRGGLDQWTRHDFDAPSSHLAARTPGGHFLREPDENTDRYVTCDQGHEHWGAAGASGLLVRHEGRYLLQHRSPYVQHGGTWSTPGGALARGESPEEGARREAEEKFGPLPDDMTHHHTFTDDHGGWAYHTVVMDSPHRFDPEGSGEGDWETQGHGWFTPQEMKGLQLHPGFAASWEKVRKSGAKTASSPRHSAWIGWTADRPHQAVIQRAQERFREDHPELTEPLDDHADPDSFFHGRESAKGTELLRSVLRSAGHPDAARAWAAPHARPERRVSQIAVDAETGAPGVVLHPERYNRATLAHEAAHLVHAHQTGVDWRALAQGGAVGDEIETGIPDHVMHGPEFARHYARALDQMSPGSGADFMRRHAEAVTTVGNARHRVHGLPRDFGGGIQREAAADGPWYHGCPYELGESDQIDRGASVYTHFTPHRWIAEEVAANKSWDGNYHVYEVEPSGDYEHDPEYEPGQSYRTREPLHIIREAATGYDLSPRSGMIYLDIPDDKVRHLPGGVDDHHITLVYLGKDVSDDAFAKAVRRTREAAEAHPPMEGSIGGLGSFPPSDSSDGKTPVFVPVDVPGIRRLRRSLEDLNASQFKDYKPHVTLAYLEDGEAMPAPHPTVPVSFDRLHVKRGDDVKSFPFGGRLSKAAAWDASGSERHGVYLRFGDWPHDERSYSPAGGYKEEGVSVYDLDRNGNPSIDHGLDRGHVHDDSCDVDEFGTCIHSPDPGEEPDNDPQEEMQGRVHRAERNRRYGDDRPGGVGHLVRGEISGVGFDGEPLLKNVRRVGDWIDHRHLFIPGAQPHRLARDEASEDYEPPEENPRP